MKSGPRGGKTVRRLDEFPELEQALRAMATSSRVACFALSCSIAMYDEIAWVK